MAKKDTSVLKWKRKKWVHMVSPAPFGEQSIGETLVLEPQDLVDKTITVNLMHLTRNMKKQNFNITFKAIDTEGHTKSYALVMQPSSIKRLIRAGRDRIDESFVIKSNDGVYARIKPLFVTFSHQPANMQTRVRRSALSFIRKYAAEKSFDDFMKDVVDSKLQKELHQHIKKFLKLRTCEIRALEIIENFSALKQKQLEKRQEREAKKLEQEEMLEAKREEERKERAELREAELAERNANQPAPDEIEAAEEKAAKAAEQEAQAEDESTEEPVEEKATPTDEEPASAEETSTDVDESAEDKKVPKKEE